jgi:hypothetical protein
VGVRVIDGPLDTSNMACAVSIRRFVVLVYVVVVAVAVVTTVVVLSVVVMVVMIAEEASTSITY